MFGDSKMYKKGYADALAAKQDFNEKLEAANEHVREEKQQGKDIDEEMLRLVKEDIGNVSQYLETQESRRLYNLDACFDIQKMDDQQKELLVAVLIQLAEDEGSELTGYQRKYVSSVQQYLQVTQPATSADLKAVGNIDSLAVQKAFLQVALEFFYLQDGDELSEPQMEFLSYFSVNQSQREDIELNVSRYYNAWGPEGLARHYDPIPEGEDEGEDEDEAAATENWYEQLKKQLPDPAALEEITLSEDITISEGEEKIYKDQIIDFQGTINCEGTLIFEHCILNCSATSDSSRIKVRERGALRLHNCRIRKEEDGGGYFIETHTRNALVSIDACSFTDAKNFMCGKGGIVLKKSILKNMGEDFINQHSGDIFGGIEEEVSISDCVFFFPNWCNAGDKQSIFGLNIISCSTIKLARCSIRGNLTTEQEKTWRSPYTFLSANKGSIRQCSFHDMCGIIQGGSALCPEDTLDISLTRFDHCVDLMKGKMTATDCLFERSTSVAVGLDKDSKIIRCQFHDCYNNLISNSFIGSNSITVGDCRFNNWEGAEKNYNLFLEGSSLMTFWSAKKDVSDCQVYGCEFNGIRAHNSMIIAVKAFGKIDDDHYVVRVHDCKFGNCCTDRTDKLLIQEYDTYVGAFKRKKQQTVSFEYGNTGLDNINKGSGRNDNVKRMEFTAADERIGAEIDPELDT